MSPIGVSLMGFASPKSTQKTAPLRSKNFVNKEFLVCEAQNTVNPDGFTSILTKPQRKIFVSKSDSSLNALARVQYSQIISKYVKFFTFSKIFLNITIYIGLKK